MSSDPTLGFRLAPFSDESAAEQHTTGLAYLAGRLQELGYDPDIGKLSEDREIECEFLRHEEPLASTFRDISFYQCNDIVFVDLWRGSVSVSIDSLIGHLDVRLADVRRGQDIHIAAVNDRAVRRGFDTTLISPSGEVRAASSRCSDYVGGAGDCFAHNADTRCGSSGGAIVIENTNDVFGVVQGERSWSVDDRRHCSFRVFDWAEGRARNTGTYFSSVGADLHRLSHMEVARGYLGGPLIDGITTANVGASGSSPLPVVLCPPGHYVAGVRTVGADDPGLLGSIGLVCMPLEDMAAGPSEFTFPTEVAKFFYPGDPWLGLESERDLDYWDSNVVFESRAFDTREVFCPAGYFLNGISFWVDAFGRIAGILGLECEAWNQSFQPLSFTRYVDLDWRFAQNGYSVETASCGVTLDGRPQVVVGMYATQELDRISSVRVDCRMTGLKR